MPPLRACIPQQRVTMPHTSIETQCSQINIFKNNNKVHNSVVLSTKLWKHSSEVAQSCPILCDPMDWSLPGSSIHGIFQARVLEWVAISFSRGSSQPRDRTQVSRIRGRRFNLWATREAPVSIRVLMMVWWILLSPSFPPNSTSSNSFSVLSPPLLLVSLFGLCFLKQNPVEGVVF